MKTYTVVKEQKLIEKVTYTVDAESKDDAIRLVEDGEVDDNDDHWTEDTGEVNYNIENEED
jgi:hypothetical protein